MSYTIDEIQGIGPTYKEKFTSANISTTEALLKECGTRSGRKSLAEKSGFTESQILDWTNMADMMRINGVGGQFAELLKGTGVDTVKELATRNPENLTEAMEKLNAEKHLAKTQPSLSMVMKWVEEAKTMAPAISH
jgi:predicted flap endonuclease-1-like 5' DNA nuclease